MKVLVIEDDASTAELLKIRLERLECEVHFADSPEGAMKVALEEKPQLILADLKLDGSVERGLETIRCLREGAITHRIPIILHSIYVEHGDEAPIDDLPVVDGCLPKPFKLRQLVDMITLHRDHPELRG